MVWPTLPLRTRPLSLQCKRNVSLGQFQAWLQSFSESRMAQFIEPLWMMYNAWTDGKPYRWWHYQMETLSALLNLCAGINRSPVNSTHKDQWRGAWMFSLIWAWTNGCVNIRDAADLRRHRAHNDVIVMSKHYSDGTWFSCCLELRTSRLCITQLAQASNKEGITLRTVTGIAECLDN